ncbi:MAG: 4Fe-4S cluster-binding domain-containing protein [Lachnospiraceae bacterium]|nr:4Fe-4S cluster-binding domain-containing protein [Lachnospiraceae bacterium]
MSDLISKNPYKTRSGGCTCTVFVPYDCNNHCPFCINKKEYADTSTFSLEKIINSIKVIDSITPCCDFVFTGGEPLANLESLQRMLDVVPLTHKVYINTTFPVQPNVSADEVLSFVSSNKQKITCINISRHMHPYVEESPDELVSRIETRKRINCVLYKNYNGDDKLYDFAKRWGKYQIPIQFRYDYTETTPENLYEIDNDAVLQDLMRHFTYIGLDGCRMRNGFHFKYYIEELGLWERMTYHKTLPYSTIVEKDKEDGITYDILYDILIKQNGDFHSDWTNVPLDIEKYKKVKFEPYDLKFLYKNEKEWID